MNAVMVQEHEKHSISVLLLVVINGCKEKSPREIRAGWISSPNFSIMSFFFFFLKPHHFKEITET